MTPYANVPSRWSWILDLPGVPLLVLNGLREYGTLEGAGVANNPKVIGWADEIVKAFPTNYTNWAADFYNKDSIPWCGLFMALMAVRSANGRKDRMPPNSYLSALSWASWGTPVDWHSSLNNVFMGDVGVFLRSGGGHVAMCIAVTTDNKWIATLGGNQSDQVNIALHPVSNLYAVRRPKYMVAPQQAKNFRISASGVPVTSSDA